MNFHILKRKIYSLIVLIPTVLVSGLHVNPTWQTTSTNPTLLNQFDLITETTGWVLLDGQLFWTSDGGQSWDEIGPSIPVDAAVQDVQFFDSNTGWILWMTPNSDGSSSFTIAHTNDQGANWSTITPSLFDSGDVASHAAKAQMGWFDAQTGWIAVKQSSSSNFSVGTLFTTSDAGKTWTRSILPVADRVTFSNPQLGWASGSPTGDQIFRTQNGGRTWHSTKPDLPLNAAATAYEPFFTNGRGSVVITSVAEEGLALRAFSASSNGWLPMGQVTVKTQAGTIGLSMIDAQNFVAVIPGTNSIVRMHNGSIETLANQDGLSASIRDLDMASLDVGWAKSVDSECTTAFLDNGSASVSCTSSTRLLRTQDGGVTWKDIQLPVVNGNAATGASELSQPLAVSSIPNVGNTEVFIGQGFDICEVPTISQLQTWSTSSPYKVINLYIGGSSRACLNTALTSTYLKKMYHQGWKFIPTWVGPQAPCTGYSSRISSDVGTAYNQGTSEANLAAERLAELGLTYPDKTKSAVYYDIEHYGTNTTCREAVKAFMNGWVSQLHARGNIAGVYGSTLCNTGLSDFLTNANVPDTIWAARWYHNLGQGYYDPTATVWNLGSCISNTVWSNHQRIRQYEGEHEETWGDLTLGIDSNVLDAVVAIPYPDPARISFQELVSGLNNPVFVTNANDGSGRLFVVERSGFIRIIKNGTLLTTPFLDIHSIVQSAGGEQGLLGLAFHPSYGTNGKFYVAYTAPRDGDTTGSVLTLKQYSVSAGNPDLANAAGGNTVLTIDHHTYSNHNGGALAFGNDGYLYWSTGDGGGAGDPNNNAQNLTRLLGKILRINVNAGSPYSIPSSNPFYGSADTSIKKEIWAYGLRNPWRISFDRATHDLYIGDVGQGVREEIDFQPASSGGGQNYGWRIMEGSLCYNPASGCNQTGKVLPIAEYDHTLGCSVTGGYVYRGSNSPSLSGYYLYGDYCSGRVFTVHKTSSTSWSTPVQLADTAFNITSFGEDEQGELYLADYATGKIYKIKYAEPYYLINGNAGAAGVTLSYVDGTTKTITSQPDGKYSIQVPGGWSGTITPAKTCYTFNPPNRSYSTISENQIGQNYVATFNNASGCANVSVSIGGSLLGKYGVPNHGGFRQGYNLDSGPVNVTSTNDLPILSSERFIFSYQNSKSYAEMMGYPDDQLATDYWFTWYNNLSYSTQLRVSNMGTNSAEVKVYAGNGIDPIDTFTLQAGEGKRVSYNIDSGPLHVVSTDGVTPILASERFIQTYLNSASYAEMMGYPGDQLATEYWFPWYNNLSYSTQLRVSNLGNNSAEIKVYAGNSSEPIDTITLAAGQGARKAYNIDNGPLHVVSTDGTTPILASERFIQTFGASASYAEMMGYAGDQLTSEYCFPWYNNTADSGVTLSSQLRVSNMGATSVDVKVYLAGSEIDSFTLTGGQGKRGSYPTLNNGPLCVVRTSGTASILASERFISTYLNSASYSEMMGYPTNQFASSYWFPWYNNLSYSTELRIAHP